MVLVRDMQAHRTEPQCPAWGRTHLVAKFMGTLVKRASPLTKGPPMSLGPELPRALGAPHLFSFPGLCAGEEENMGEKNTVFSGQFTGARRTQVPSSACLLREGGKNPKSKGCSVRRASSPLLANFKFFLQRPRLGSQGKREKAIEKGVQVIF